MIHPDVVQHNRVCGASQAHRLPIVTASRQHGFASNHRDGYTLQTAQLLTELPMTHASTPAFIDFEASSLDLIASYPIEVGVCLPDGAVYSWLIRPHVLWHDWSESAEAIHGIPRQALMEKGHAVHQVAGYLNDLLSGQVFCDAWTFDSFWLHRLFRAADMQPAFQLESISLLLNPSQERHWTPARQKVIAELGLPVHRAANDARILQATWQLVTTADQDRSGSVQGR